MDKKIQLLIVEDSPTQAMKLRMFLEEKGYEVIWAKNGKEGLTMAGEYQPDIIISDVVMPEMDGYEMCRHIKENDVTRHIPVLLMTSLSGPGDLIKGLEARADYYVTKPYSVEYLLARLDDIMTRNWTRTKTDEPSEMEFVFNGKNYCVNSSRAQIMSLLLSTYENTVQRNSELIKTKGVLQDVNRKLEDKLQELKNSEDRFRSLVMTIPDIVYRIDPEGKFIFVNAAISRLGYTPEELVGKHFSTILLPVDVDHISRDSILKKLGGTVTGDENAPKLFDERRTGVRKTTDLEVRLLPKHGMHTEPAAIEALGDKLITVDINSSGMYGVSPGSKEKIFIGTVGVIRDISIRKKMEQTLEESREYLRIILDHTDTGILIIDPKNYVIVDANPAAIKMMRSSRDAVVGSVCHQVFCPVKKEECPVVECGGSMEKSERVMLTSDGRQIPILKTVTTVTINRKEHFLESFMDISEIKKVQVELNIARDNLEQKVREKTADLVKSQADLVQAEKIAAVGTLTAGIAHEINNPLMGMQNYIEYCLKHTPKDHRTYPVLEDTKHETERCTKIVKNLLTFSRIEKTGQEQYEKISCATLLGRVFSLLSYRIEKGNILVVNEYPENIPPIRIKPTNIQQVFLNLIGNAVDALEKEEKKELAVRMAIEDKFLRISIIDNGPGIDEETLAKIFDPFFTTKPVGKGTGLGLSVSMGIVRDHGGEIVCKSRIGEGTDFTVILPIGGNESTHTKIDKET